MISARLLGLAAAAALTLGGCGDGTEAARADGERPLVAVSFYPLQFLAERVAGGAVEVVNLTPPGAEPPDLELSPQDVATVDVAALVVHLEGFQPALDTAVTDTGAAAMDVSQAARLMEPADGGGADPHFWLDPTRVAAVGEALSSRLGEIVPAQAATFTANAEQLAADLTALDEEMATGLAVCSSRDLVVSHEAFGYLAERYDLEQRGIAGLDAEAEPDARTVAAVADFVAAHDVRTIYVETLVSPEVADTVAAETGAATAVLDPLEGLTDETAGEDYLSVMRTNLATLRTGQPCP